MDQLVENELYHIATKADVPALTYIISKYILRDDRKSAWNRSHNYALYMRRMLGWRLLA